MIRIKLFEKLQDILKQFSFGQLYIRYHSRFFVRVGHETTYAAIGDHNFFTIPCHRQTYLSSVKPVQKCYLCTDFTEVLNNFDRSDDDMV